MNQPTIVDHSKRAHAWAPPSASSRWAGYLREQGCPASLERSYNAIKKPENEASKEGTKAHQLLQICLENRLFDARQYIMASLYPDEMLTTVNVCLKFIGDIVQRFPDVEIHCEQEAYITFEYWGRVDIILYHRATGQLWVIDFKNGTWPVKVEGNPQLLSYMLGIVDKFPQAHDFSIAVVQPHRKDGGRAVQAWPVSRADLEAFAMQAAKAIQEGHSAVPIYRPSPDKCRYCEGAYGCPAILSSPVKVDVPVTLGKAPRKKPNQPKEAPPFLNQNGQVISLQEISPLELQRVSEALIGLPVVRAYVKNIEDLVKELAITHLLQIPGFKQVYKKERIIWDADWKTICNVLWQIGGISPAEVMPQSLIAITTAKELLTEALKGKPEAEVTEAWRKFAELTTRAPTDNIELVPDSDERPHFQSMADHKAGFDNIVYVPTGR